MPERALVAPADVALEVDAPGLGASAGVAQGSERDGELRAPAEVAREGAHLPGAVPVAVEAVALPVAADLAVVLDAGRVGAEDEAVLAVVVRVQHQLEAVGLVQGRVAAALRHDDAARLEVVADDTHVERVRAVAHTHLGALRGRLAFVGGGLLEAAQDGDPAPAGIVQHGPVEHGLLGERPGHGLTRQGRQRRAPGQQQGGGQQGGGRAWGLRPCARRLVSAPQGDAL